MLELLAIGSEEAVTWSDLLFIAIGVLVILAIIYFVKRT